jgi:hypothetical protein
MLEEFEQRAHDYYGGKKNTIPKALKNKDKYEKNLQIGKTFKKNPLVKIFNRV